MVHYQGVNSVSMRALSRHSTMIGHNFIRFSSNDKRAPDRRSFDWLGRRYRACPAHPRTHLAPRANRNKVRAARIERERKGSRGLDKLDRHMLKSQSYEFI